jgi:hypothetical protein
MGVYLSWLQVELGHHTRTPNRWSVHQRCLTTSCSPFRLLCIYLSFMCSELWDWETPASVS